VTSHFGLMCLFALCVSLVFATAARAQTDGVSTAFRDDDQRKACPCGGPDRRQIDIAQDAPEIGQLERIRHRPRSRARRELLVDEAHERLERNGARKRPPIDEETRRAVDAVAGAFISLGLNNRRRLARRDA